MGLRLEGVSKRFATSSAPIVAADEVTLEVGKGELIALLGPSGCGKTTTLRLIAGFERVDSGLVEIDGRVVASKGVHLPPQLRRVGMVFQEYALFPHVNVLANIQFGLRRLPEEARAARTREVMELAGLSGLEERMPHQLSGGQQQRVALARALAPHPALILLDEPFSNLDAGLRARVREEVREILRAANTTAIFVTHDQEEALSLVDRVAVMLDGRVEQVAPPHELYANPASRAVAEFIGEANFLPGVGQGETIECELGVVAARQSGSRSCGHSPAAREHRIGNGAARTTCFTSSRHAVFWPRPAGNRATADGQASDRTLWAAERICPGPAAAGFGAGTGDCICEGGGVRHIHARAFSLRKDRTG